VGLASAQPHSVLVEQESGEEYTSLTQLAAEAKGGARFEIYDRLSEFAVLGFEYGYSVVDQDALVLGWRRSATSPTERRW
jgi:2-oxoglutarate decarboxylase